MLLVQRHCLFALTLTGDRILLPLVLGLDLLHLRLKQLHATHGLDLLQVQRQNREPYQNGQNDDGENPADTGTARDTNESQCPIDGNPDPREGHDNRVKN